jgi:fibronectin type 3 domain-containing protein
MKTGSPEEAKSRKMTAFVEDLEPRKVYVYEVVSFNRRGHSSAPSNPATVYWDFPPHVPAMVRGERGDRRVELSWEPVVDAMGYNVYRRGENETFSLRSLSREPIEETRYTDLNVENDRKYIYSIRAVKRVVKTNIEGKGSLEFSVTPVDLIPTAPPTGLVAIPLKNGMELNWRKNEEPDLLGYFVYRRKVGEREYKRLFADPLKKETYLDASVELGEEYEYAVSAVDNSPRRNESPRSEEIRVKNQY